MQRLLKALSPPVVALLLFVVYMANGTFSPGRDSSPSVYVPVSLLTQGNVTFTPTEVPWAFAWQLTLPQGSWTAPIERWSDKVEGVPLSEYLRRGQLKWVTYGYFVVPSRRYAPDGEQIFINGFGVLHGLLGLPFLYVISLIEGPIGENTAAIWFVGKLVAALCVAISAGALHALLRRLTTPTVALLAAVCYGLGSCVWSVSSQALWQHGPNVLFISLSLLFWHKSLSGSARDSVLAGFFLAVAASCRPTSLALVAAVGLWAVIYRKKPLPWLLGAAPVLLWQFGFNWYYFGSPLTVGQTILGHDLAIRTTGSPQVFQTLPWMGLIHVLFSPSRGLFVFSPIFVFAIPGFWWLWQQERFQFSRPFLLGGALILLAEVSHFDWWGGYSFGYRHIVDLCPLLVLALVPFLERLRRQPTWRPVFAVFLLWSIAVQIIGVYAYDLYGWNQRDGHGVGDPHYRYRLWSWTDSQLVYSLTHWSQAHAARLAQNKGTIESTIFPVEQNVAEVANEALSEITVLPLLRNAMPTFSKDCFSPSGVG